MDNPNLEDLLRRYQEAPTPKPPLNLDQKVWREIRVRQESPLPSLFFPGDFLAWFRGNLTRLTAPALALTVLVSVGLTFGGNQASTPSAQQALGLGVFSQHASPLNRLTQNP